jgi:hypothetical protein
LIDAIASLGIARFSIEKQREFIALMSSIVWNADDGPDSISFWIYFGPENEVLDEFVDAKHQTPARFAMNPQALREFLGYGESDTVLIVNGRVYTPFESITFRELQLIDGWSKEFVCKWLSVHQAAITTPIAHAILACFLMDWRTLGIVREPSLLGEHLHSFQSVLAYTSAESTLIRLELHTDPFSQDCQRIIDMVYWLEKRGVIDLRLILVPRQPTADGALSCYYRAAYFDELLRLSHIDDAAAYKMTPVAPPSWVLELAGTTFSLDALRFRGGPDHAEFAVVRILAEGQCGPGPDLLELVTADARTVCAPNGYFQLPVLPGEAIVELLRDNGSVRWTMLGIGSFGRADFRLHDGEMITNHAVRLPEVQATGERVQVVIAVDGGPC